MAGAAKHMIIMVRVFRSCFLMNEDICLLVISYSKATGIHTPPPDAQ